MNNDIVRENAEKVLCIKGRIRREDIIRGFDAGAMARLAGFSEWMRNAEAKKMKEREEEFRIVKSIKRRSVAVIIIFSGLIPGCIMRNVLIHSNYTYICGERTDDFLSLFDITMGIAFWVSAVAFLMWVYRAAANAASISRTKYPYSPGMSVAFFFIPMANFVMPYRVVKAIYNGTMVPESPHFRKRTATMVIWWVAFLLMNFTADLIEISDAFAILSAILLISFVRKISRTQESYVQQGDK